MMNIEGWQMVERQHCLTSREPVRDPPSPRSSFLYWKGPVHSLGVQLNLVSILKY